MRPVLNGQGAVAHAKSGIDFERLLNNLSRLLAHNNRPQRCFVSYARPNDPYELEQLKNWIGFLKTSLEPFNIKVTWDSTIQGHPIAWMLDNIRDSQWIVLVGTPLYKERANIPGTGVNVEMQEIGWRMHAGRVIVLPVYYNGTLENAIPDDVRRVAFALDVRHPDLDYGAIMSSEGPVGIVPRIHEALQQDDRYIQAWKNFSSDRRNIYYKEGVVPAEEPQPYEQPDVAERAAIVPATNQRSTSVRQQGYVGAMGSALGTGGAILTEFLRYQQRADCLGKINDIFRRGTPSCTPLADKWAKMDAVMAKVEMGFVAVATVGLFFYVHRQVQRTQRNYHERPEVQHRP